MNAAFSLPKPLNVELSTIDKKEPRAMYADIVQVLPSNGPHADKLTGTERSSVPPSSAIRGFILLIGQQLTIRSSG
jgi:hypothetical protein